MNKPIYCLFLILMIYLCVEAISFSGLFLLRTLRHIEYAPIDVLSDAHRRILSTFINGELNYLSHSSRLGWTITQNGHSHGYEANSRGIRSSKEYALRPPHNLLRIACFGDSFTHGDDVNNTDTWEAQLESLRPNLEVLNFGVGGFGFDQAYLRYLTDGVPFEPHMVFIGFMSENIFRNVNRYRPFYMSNTGIPLAKPRFILKNGQLSLLPNPMTSVRDYSLLLSHPRETLSQVGANDYYYAHQYTSSLIDVSPTIRLIKILMSRFGRQDSILVDGYYNEDSEAFHVTKKLFDDFYRAAIRNRAFPVILIFPGEADLERYREQATRDYAPLLAYFTTRGYLYIDLLAAFDTGREVYDLGTLFTETAHYSPFGNQLVAKYLDAYLERNGLRGRDEVLDKLNRLSSRLVKDDDR